MKLYKSFKKHFKFVFATHYITEDGRIFEYASTKLETFGDKLLYPFSIPLDTFLKYLNWQLVLFTLVLGLFIAITLFYYPEEVSKLIELIIPIFKWEYTKLFFFLMIQVYINSLFIRTWGRLSNTSLMRAWLTGDIR